ncbi:MAG TPA: hypothetical protein VEN81_10550 [Planctomycetota bacterium]|nr:hypothetical protein [Planctomycetota bacterium]
MTRETSLGGPAAAFPETAWSTVLRAKDDGTALGRLIERSWKPLYFFARRQGADVETAKDRVQAFFAHLLEVRLMDRVVQGRGRFRSFLLAAFDHFLANDYRLWTAEKRGGTARPLSLDFAQAETQYLPSGDESPEDLYRRAWASDVLRAALEALRAEIPDRFDLIRAHLLADGPRPTYRESARGLGVSEFEIANLLHRARVRLGELIVLQVRDTVEDDPQDEVRDLLQAFRRNS